jgi:hypothetical protein
MGHGCSASFCAMLLQGNIEKCILLSFSSENENAKRNLALAMFLF